MTEDTQDLIPVPEAARRAEVARNTMRLAVSSGAIAGLKLGRDWFVRASDIERWKRENYMANKARRSPKKSDDTSST